MSDLSVAVTLTARTCSCGYCWATPNWMTSNPCPQCLQRRLIDTEGWWRNSQEKNADLYRRLAALKGVVTKMRGKR
jgi:hypothetical protein